MFPRNPQQLAERLVDPVFRDQQRRRAQTEGRIAILKQTLLGGRLQTMGIPISQWKWRGFEEMFV
jgi:hypothetical protein